MISRWKAQSAQWVDRAMAQAIRFQVGRTGPIPGYDDGMQRIRELQRAYPACGAVDDAEFFPQREAPPLRVRALGELEGAKVEEWSWRSDFEPWLDEVRPRYLSREPNRTAWCRVYFAGNDRPVLLLQHGFLGGYWPIEERKFHIRAWIRRGFSVAVPLLPFHGLRAEKALRTPPPFPGHDLAITIEGFRQAVGDLRALRSHLQGRGAGALAALGMSLGAYTLALWATVDPIEFVALFTPASSIAEIAREHGQLGAPDVAAQLAPHLADALSVVSPLRRAPRVTSEQVMVVGGDEDRITPSEHAERFAAHFGVPLRRIPGGHLLQFGRADALGTLHQRLLQNPAFFPAG